MKAYLKILVVSTLIGIFIAILYFKKLKQDDIFVLNTLEKVSIFQVGVFSSYDNAINYTYNYGNAGIYKKDNFYHVIIAVTINNQEQLKSYFKNKNINFIIKEDIVNEKKYNVLKKYDLLLLKSNDEKAINKINKESVTLFLTK